jgi:hypothetical protein
VIVVKKEYKFYHTLKYYHTASKVQDCATNNINSIWINFSIASRKKFYKQLTGSTTTSSITTTTTSYSTRSITQLMGSSTHDHACTQEDKDGKSQMLGRHLGRGVVTKLGASVCDLVVWWS